MTSKWKKGILSCLVFLLFASLTLVLHQPVRNSFFPVSSSSSSSLLVTSSSSLAVVQPQVTSHCRCRDLLWTEVFQKSPQTLPPETIHSGFSLSHRNILLTLSIHPHPKFWPESLELHCCLQLSRFFPALSFYSSFTASSSSSFSSRVIGTKIDEIVTHGLQLVYQVFVLTNGNRRWKESET